MTDQFPDTTKMTQLSPAAQAVLDAAHEAWITKDAAPSIAAAALRAAVDQLARPRGSWMGASTVINSYELLAIANELDPQP